MAVPHEYSLVGRTKRTVVDTVSLKVIAVSREDAKEKARLVLEQYPDAHEVDGVSYCYIENRENGEPEVLSVEVDMEDLNG